jgi:hypothetical protein
MMTMPPSAHTLAPMMTTMTQTSKPKIGFSIDSIVGNRNSQNKSPINFSHDSEGSEAPLSPLSDYSPKHDLATTIKLNEYAQLELRNNFKRSQSTSPQPDANNKQRLIKQELHARLSMPENSRRSQSPASPSAHHMQKTPIIVPGIPANILRQQHPLQHSTQLPPTLTAEMMATQNPFFRLVTSLLLPT